MALTLAITGGTGFVGRHVMAEAQARGHGVRALTRKPQRADTGVCWVAGSLETEAALASLVAGADAIIHIAGLTNARSRAEFDAGNAAGTAAMRAVAGTRPFVHVSSLAAREPSLSHYGASKRQAEDVARGVCGPLVMLRPPGVYGPGDSELLALFKASRFGLVPVPAGARASMIFAPDLARALVALAEDLAGAARTAGGCFEIDDGTGGYAQAEVAQAAARAIGGQITALPVPGSMLSAAAAFATAAARLRGKLPTLSFDRARYLAHRDWTANAAPLIATGLWKPETGLAKGMALTADWYRREGWLQ